MQNLSVYRSIQVCYVETFRLIYSWASNADFDKYLIFLGRPKMLARKMLRTLGHAEWLRFGVRDRIIRFFYHNLNHCLLNLNYFVFGYL
jgi:hypothetical protein